MQLFSKPFHEYKVRIQAYLGGAIDHLSEEDVLAAEDQQIEKLVARYKLSPLEVNWESSISLVSRAERRETVYDSPWDGNREVIRQAYTFEVGYTGSRELLGIKPSTSKMWTFEPTVTDNTIRFDVVDKGSEQANKQKLQMIRSNLEHDISHLNSELAQYHNEITEHVRRLLKERKERIQSAVEGMNSFGVPIRGGDLG